jgi:AcrR family transcriptional regulator
VTTRRRAKRTPARAKPLDRGIIARAALRLIDQYGLESFSMRKLGSALGVEAMSVYHHFKNKGELLDGVLDVLLDEIEPALDRPGTPLDRLRACFEDVRRLAVVHPHAFWIIPPRRFRTPRALAFYERLLEVFNAAGFDAATSARFFRLLAGYVTGAGMAEIGSRALQPGATPVILEDFSDPKAFPRITSVVPHLRRENLDALFEFGMDTIFDAMKRHLDEKG